MWEAQEEKERTGEFNQSKKSFAARGKFKRAEEMDLDASCGWEKKRRLVGAHVREQLMYMNIQLFPKETSPSGNSINSHEHQCFKVPG